MSLCDPFIVPQFNRAMVAKYSGYRVCEFYANTEGDTNEMSCQSTIGLALYVVKVFVSLDDRIVIILATRKMHSSYLCER